jgi:hypothetical protein
MNSDEILLIEVDQDYWEAYKSVINGELTEAFIDVVLSNDDFSRFCEMYFPRNPRAWSALVWGIPGGEGSPVIIMQPLAEEE